MIIEKLQSSAKRRERYKAIEALRLVCKPWRAMLQERLDSLECLWPSGMDIVQMPPVTQFSRLRRLEVAIDTDTGDGWSYHSVPTEFDISSVAALRHLTHLTITTSSPEGFLEIHCSLLPQSVQDINLRNMKLKAGRDFCLPNAKRLQFHAPGISYEDSLTGLPSFLANMPNLKVAAVTLPRPSAELVLLSLVTYLNRGGLQPVVIALTVSVHYRSWTFMEDM